MKKKFLALLLSASVLVSNGSIASAMESTDTAAPETAMQEERPDTEDSADAGMDTPLEVQETEESFDQEENSENLPEADMPQEDPKMQSFSSESALSAASEEELTEGDYSYTVADGGATITKYNGTDGKAVIPEQIGGYPVVSLGQEVFRDNATLEAVHIPATVTFIGRKGDVGAHTFDNTAFLKTITVASDNPVYFSMDGVLFMYSGNDGLPFIFKYPSAKEDATYIIPVITNQIGIEGIAQCKNLKKIIIPENVSGIMQAGLWDLSNTSIILQQTDPRQIELYRSFSKLENCTIIVKNEAMRDSVNAAIGKACTGTAVKLESELSDSEKTEYLTPASSLTFGDGGTVKNLTLAPGDSRDISYSLLPAGCTDAVTWKSSNPKIAAVSSVNGKVNVTGIANGKCTVTGQDQSGHAVILNMDIYQAVNKTEINDGWNTNTTQIQQEDIDDFFEWIYFYVYPGNAGCRKNVTWKSSNPNVVSVSKYDEGIVASGSCYEHVAKLQANAPGRVTVTATLRDRDKVINRSVTYMLTRDICECDIQVSDVSYGGGSPNPKITVKDGNAVLRKGTDYSVSFENRDGSEWYAWIAGKGNYTGKTYQLFRSVPADISKASVKVSSCTYNGKKQTPFMTVVLDGKTLKKNTDYTVSCSSKNPGTGKAVIRGKGNYTGTKTVSFTIRKGTQKISGIKTSYQKACKSSFALKPKAKGKISYKSSNPKIAAVNSRGKVQIKGTGKAVITVKAESTSLYNKAAKKVTIYAVPQKQTIKDLKAGKKKITLRWTKDKKADGYQIQYSTDSRFKKADSASCSKNTSKKTIKKLKTGKKYYVRIRSYKKIGKTKYYGSWSRVKSVRVK